MAHWPSRPNRSSGPAAPPSPCRLPPSSCVQPTEGARPSPSPPDLLAAPRRHIAERIRPPRRASERLLSHSSLPDPLPLSSLSLTRPLPSSLSVRARPTSHHRRSRGRRRSLVPPTSLEGQPASAPSSSTGGWSSETLRVPDRPFVNLGPPATSSLTGRPLLLLSPSKASLHHGGELRSSSLLLPLFSAPVTAIAMDGRAELRRAASRRRCSRCQGRTSTSTCSGRLPGAARASSSPPRAHCRRWRRWPNSGVRLAACRRRFRPSRGQPLAPRDAPRSPLSNATSRVQNGGRSAFSNEFRGHAAAGLVTGVIPVLTSARLTWR